MSGRLTADGLAGLVEGLPVGGTLTAYGDWPPWHGGGRERRLCLRHAEGRRWLLEDEWRYHGRPCTEVLSGTDAGADLLYEEGDPDSMCLWVRTDGGTMLCKGFIAGTITYVAVHDGTGWRTIHEGRPDHDLW